jgi:hypothetical protein
MPCRRLQAQMPCNPITLCRNLRRGVAFSVILLKREVRKLVQNLLHDRDNNPRVRSFINRLPIFLPKQPTMPPIFPRYGTLKHPFNFKLKSSFNAICVVNLFSANFSCNAYSSMLSWFHSSFVTLKDSILLLICPK